MTREDFMAKTDDELKNIAESMSNKITLVRDVDLNAVVKASEEERQILFEIFYAALLTYSRDNGNYQTICDMAEFAGIIRFEKHDVKVSCYETIYKPLQKLIGKWR